MIRLIYDECNPTRDRRPTTAEDVENDIHVEEYDSISEMIEDFVSEGYEEFAEDEGIDPNNEMEVLEAWLGYYNDPGDGSPNIQYISIDGVPYESNNVLTYDCLENLDLETATEEDVITAILGDYEDDYDYDEDEEDMDESWYKGIDDEGDTDFVEEKVEDYSDDYINEKYENLIGKKIRIIHMDDPYASERYAGKEGVIENVATDPWGDVYYDGTWGGLSIYPNIDTIEFIDDFDIDDAANKLVAMAKADGKNLSLKDAKEVLDQSFNQDVDNLEDFYNRLNFDEDLNISDVNEGLFDAKDINYGHKAWILNQIISSMNDETAYYDTEWLYTWPDGETEQECNDDFGDKESFEDLERTFLSIYQYNDAEEGEDPEDAEYNFHRDGLYNPTEEAVEVAHEYDKKLGLDPIKVYRNGKLVDESLKEDIDDNITSEGNITKIAFDFEWEDYSYRGDIEYNGSLNVLVSINSKEYNTYIPFDLSTDYNYSFSGSYYPATRWEPAEYPDLELDIDEITLDNVDFDVSDFEVTEPKVTDKDENAMIFELLESHEYELKKFIIDNQKEIISRIEDKMYNDDDLYWELSDNQSDYYDD